MRALWSFLWLGWFVALRPLWRLPLRLGWRPTPQRFGWWGDVLGLGFALRQSQPAFLLLHRYGISL